MIHKMNLWDSPFQMIKSGYKTVELRLNDQKRKSIRSGDFIQFANNQTNDSIIVVVRDVQKFEDFKNLYQYYSKESMGYMTNEDANPEDMYQYYSKEKITEYGAIAIEISLIDSLSNPPTYDDFKSLIISKLKNPKGEYIELTAGDLHREIGGYPNRNHRIPVCCKVMRDIMTNRDVIINQPPKGNGATFKVRYCILDK